MYNPTCARTGNKILRQRLLGPTLTGYHPKPLVHFRDIQALYPQLGLIDVDEKARLDEIARRKRRGKGAPKKGKLRYVVTSLFTLLCIKVKANVHPTRRNNDKINVYIITTSFSFVDLTNGRVHHCLKFVAAFHILLLI